MGRNNGRQIRVSTNEEENHIIKLEDISIQEISLDFYRLGL